MSAGIKTLSRLALPAWLVCLFAATVAITAHFGPKPAKAQLAVCSWGIKDFSENHLTLTTAGPAGENPKHHHIQTIGGPCKAAGSFPCKGVIVKMLAKEHPGQEPPWDVKELTCESVSIGCGLGIDPTREGLYDVIDETIISKHGTGKYFIAVDLYRGSCDPLGSHVYGATYEFTL